MNSTSKPEELFSQFATKGFETMTVWAEANQRIVRTLLDATATVARESLQLAVRAAEEQAQALSKATERFESVQAAFTDAVTKTKEIYARG